MCANVYMRVKMAAPSADRRIRGGEGLRLSLLEKSAQARAERGQPRVEAEEEWTTMTRRSLGAASTATARLPREHLRGQWSDRPKFARHATPLTSQPRDYPPISPRRIVCKCHVMTAGLGFVTVSCSIAGLFKPTTYARIHIRDRALPLVLMFCVDHVLQSLKRSNPAFFLSNIQDAIGAMSSRPTTRLESATAATHFTAGIATRWTSVRTVAKWCVIPALP